VKYVKDTTGRFEQRPYYEQEELDVECERVIDAFLRELHGQVRFPIATEDILKLIDRDSGDLDVYADLSSLGLEVEGVTEFRPGAKPRVKISSRLSESQALVNRYRTTLTHEYGHVHLHGHLYQMPRTAGLFDRPDEPDTMSCHRDGILDAARVDWLEWQAGYACGALLMPIGHLRQVASGALSSLGEQPPVHASSPAAAQLLRVVAGAFEVSIDAARVRLLKLGFLTAAKVPGALFRPAGG